VTKEQDPAKKATLTIRWTDYAAANLAARIAKFRKLDQFVEIDGRTGAIQFLRGPTNSRCSGTIGNDRGGAGFGSKHRKNRCIGLELVRNDVRQRSPEFAAGRPIWG
jgi:hypothetical protein